MTASDVTKNDHKMPGATWDWARFDLKVNETEQTATSPLILLVIRVCRCFETVVRVDF